MEILLFLLIVGAFYELARPKKIEKSPVEKVKDGIRDKEDGNIDADEFFKLTRKALVLEE